MTFLAIQPIVRPWKRAVHAIIRARDLVGCGMLLTLAWVGRQLTGIRLLRVFRRDEICRSLPPPILIYFPTKHFNDFIC